MRKRLTTVAMLVPLAVAATASTTANSQQSQAASPPDPSSLELPDMTPTTSSSVIRNGWKYFYFHKEGVTYQEAFEDFHDCYQFLATVSGRSELPMSVSWNSEPETSEGISTQSPYGVVGQVILGFVSGAMERRNRQSRLRRCLEPRGYVRYPISRDIWRQLTDGYSTDAIALQALAASGPTPNLEPVIR